MKREKFEIANIYIPVKRRSTLKPEVVQQIAQCMLESGQEFLPACRISTRALTSVVR